ncbi:MAG: SRPBCC family protein [Spirochaetaceae bacterium]|nr:SRPBCC family protein [Spirochaetaceae bacterium]
MVSFSVSTIINQPAEIVVQALMNPDNFSYWTMYLEKFEIIESKPGLVGSISHLHYLQNGRSYVMEDKLIACEPGKKYESQVSGEALTARVITTIEVLGKGTKMKITWSGEGRILFLKLLLPLLKGKMIKQSQSELDTFKELVEKKGSDFGELH